MPTAVLFVLYTPLTQNALMQWSVTWLSQQMGIEIKVKKVRLKFPMQIEAQGIRAGTLFATNNFSSNIRLRPLIQGVVKAEYVSVSGLHLHTDTLTDITIQRFRADDITYNLHERKGHIHRVLLDESNAVLQRDTPSKPQDNLINKFPLSLTITDMRFLHIGATYANTQMELNSRIDLIALHDIAVDTTFRTSLQDIEIEDGAFTLEQNGQEPWSLTEVSLHADSLCYSPTSVVGRFTRMAFKESHGINLQEGTIAFAWSDGTVSLPYFALHTEHSAINGHLRTLDYGSKVTSIDGDANLNIGYADARLLAKRIGGITEELANLYPTETLSASIALNGTTSQLQLTRCNLSLPTAFHLSMRGSAQDITTPQKYMVQCHYEAKTYNLDFLTTLIKDSTLHIPSNIAYKGDIFYSPDTLHVLCDLTLNSGSATVEANYMPARKAYTLYLLTDSLDIRQIMPHGELGIASLQAYITGNGTDYMSDATSLYGILQLHTLQWAERTLNNISAQISIADRRMHAYAACDNQLMQWNMKASAKYAFDTVEATIHAQISDIDMHALQLTTVDIHPALQCHATLRIDSGEVYSLQAHLSDMALTVPTQRIQPRPLTLQAMLTPDTTLLAIGSGDLTLIASAHIEGLPWQWSKDTHTLSRLDDLQATLTAGNDNPLSNYLNLIGVETDSLRFIARYTNNTLHAHLQSGPLTWRTPQMTLQGKAFGDFVWGEAFAPDDLYGLIHLTSVQYTLPAYNLQLHTIDTLSIPLKEGSLSFNTLPIYTTDKQPLWLHGKITLFGIPTAHLRLTTSGTNLLYPQATRDALLYGKAIISADIAMDGPFDALSLTGYLKLLANTSIHYTYRDAILTSSNQLDNVVTFVTFDTHSPITASPKAKRPNSGLSINLNLNIDPNVQLEVVLGASGQNRVSLQGGGMLNLQYIPVTGLRLAGKYGIEAGELNINVPLLHVSNMTIRQGSTITWSGNPKNPMLDISAEERIRASVTLDGSPQSIVFVAGVSFSETVEKLGIQFTLTAPENASMQNTLATLSPDERGKLAVALLTTGLYLGEGGTGNLMNTTLMSILQSQLDNISRDAFRTIDVSVGIEPLPDGVSGVSTRTDYSFSIAKRLWDNRIRIIIGGSVTTNNERIEDDAVIDNISIEWRINPVGNQYLRFFYEKNFENILEGEIRETGVGYAYRRRF